MAPKPKKNSESGKPGTSRDYVRGYIGSEPRYEIPKKSSAPKKASTKYSPEPMAKYKKAGTKYAAREKQVGKYGMTKQKDGRLTINVGKKPSTASKVAGTVGKVAGKAAGIAKSNVKAAKTVAGVAGKVAMAPVTGANKIAKALAKKERPVTRQMYRNFEPMMKQKPKKK
jgi:hypothetical protein